MPSVPRISITNTCWTSSHNFLHMVKNHKISLQSVMSTNQACNPGFNLVWSWYYPFYASLVYFHELSFSFDCFPFTSKSCLFSFLRDFCIYIHEREGSVIFLYHKVLARIGTKVMLLFVNALRIILLFLSSGSVCVPLAPCLSSVLVEFLGEVISVWGFLSGMVI